MKLIGKGTFTKCYLNDDGKTVTLFSSDPIKECMANGWFPRSRLFPKITYDNSNECYRMEYYPKVTSLKTSLTTAHYTIYKELKEVADICAPRNPYEWYVFWYERFETLITNKRVKEALLEALDACTNYGHDIGFEVSPGNVAVKKGKLVLLDCFFMREHLIKVCGG